VANDVVASKAIAPLFIWAEKIIHKSYLSLWRSQRKIA